MRTNRAANGSLWILLAAVMLAAGAGLTIKYAFAAPVAGRHLPVAGSAAPDRPATDNRLPPVAGSHSETPAGVDLPAAPQTADAFAHLVYNGTTPASITVSQGVKFTLDLYINCGTNTNVSGQQTYMTFNNALLQVVSPSGTSCNPSSTLTADTARFEAVLQNQVCNGPGQCSFGGLTAAPGTISFASGALTNPAVGGDFRVAQITLCAGSAGDSVLHWQFAPPDPANRDSQI